MAQVLGVLQHKFTVTFTEYGFEGHRLIRQNIFAIIGVLILKLG